MKAGGSRAARWLGLGGALLGVWAATALLLHSAAEPVAVRDAKFAAAERLSFYRLEPGEAVPVQLPNDADSVRLVTHLMLPPGSHYQPERQYVYGVDVTVEGTHGEQLVSTALYTRSRQSKAQKVGDLWVQENAFTVDPDVQLTDGREFLIKLPPGIRAEQSRLRIRYTGTRGTLLVRGYSQAPARRSLLPSGHHPQRQQRAEAKAQRATFLPWDKLPADSQAALTDDAWNRLGADGEAGQDYRSEAVYRTQFRLSAPDDDATLNRLAAGRAVAVNVTGPAHLQLWLWSEERPQGSSPYPLTLQAISADGTQRSWPMPQILEGEASLVPVELPEGVHSLQLLNAGERDVRFTLSGPHDAWFAPVEVKGLPGAGQNFAPDLRRAEAYASGPTCQPVELEVADAADAAARLLRVDVRMLEPGASSAQERLLSFTALDAQGRTLDEHRVALAAEASPFELAEVPPLPDGRLPCEAAPVQRVPDSLDATAYPLAVSAPVTTRLFVPEGTRKVRLWTTHPAALSLYGFLQAPGGAVEAEPYDHAKLTEVHWRYAPLDDHNWHPLRPINEPVLSNQGAVVMLATQVRLEKTAPVGPVAPMLEFVSLTPSGDPAWQDVLEAAEKASGASTPPPSTRTMFSVLAAGTPAPVQFDARMPSRPELSVRLAGPEALGAPLEVRVDDVPVLTTTLRATRSQELLPPVAPGLHTVELRSSAPGLTATLNRPPAESGAELVKRRVYRLGKGGLRIPVTKKSAEAVTLNVVVYTAEPEATAAPIVSMVVDKGDPQRRAGVFLPRITRAARSVPLPESDRGPAWAQAHPDVHWHAHRVPLTLGEDLAPGVHYVDVTPVVEGAMWGRFFIAGMEDTGESKLWNRQGWDGEDAP